MVRLKNRKYLTAEFDLLNDPGDITNFRSFIRSCLTMLRTKTFDQPKLPLTIVKNTKKELKITLLR